MVRIPPTPSVPFNDSMQTLEIRDWSRGLATYFPAIKIDAGQFSVLHNMLIEPDKSIRVRPGIIPVGATDTDDLSFSALTGDAVSFYMCSDVNIDTSDDDEYKFLAVDNSGVSIYMWGDDATTWVSNATATMSTDYIPQFVTYTINETKDIIACNGNDLPLRLQVNTAADGTNPAYTTFIASQMGITNSLSTSACTAANSSDKGLWPGDRRSDERRRRGVGTRGSTCGPGRPLGRRSAAGSLRRDARG